MDGSRRQVPANIHHTQENTTETNIKIMFQNINGLPATVSNPKNDSLKDTMINSHIDIMGVSVE